MTPRVLTPFVIAVCVTVCLAAPVPRPVHGQTDSVRGASAPARTTAEGVFSAAQAQQGSDLYASLCQSCHTAVSHTGAPFRNKWVGRPLADLFDYIRYEMPKSEPGSLSDEEYTIVLAYLLRMNGMPAGRQPLSSDPAVLRAIAIALPTSQR